MSVDKTKENCSHSLNINEIKLPEEKNLIVPNHQNGGHDVTCNPPICRHICKYANVHANIIMYEYDINVIFRQGCHGLGNCMKSGEKQILFFMVRKFCIKSRKFKKSVFKSVQQKARDKGILFYLAARFAKECSCWQR